MVDPNKTKVIIVAFRQLPDQGLHRIGAGGAGDGLYDRSKEFHRGAE